MRFQPIVCRSATRPTERLTARLIWFGRATALAFFPAIVTGFFAIQACGVESSYSESRTSDSDAGFEALAWSEGDTTPANFKVAFLGDQGDGRAARAVLRLVHDEGAAMVLHQGDFDYDHDPEKWDATITSVLGADFPYFASVGNHDEDDFYGSGGYQEKLQQRLDRVAGAKCTGDLGVKSACRYQGLYFVLSGAGTMGRGHEDYIRKALAADSSTWRICSWHKNQTALQLGEKDNDVGWGPYEACREAGAFVVSGHEHTYSRTKTLVDTRRQKVDPDWADPANLRVAPGATFVVVAGLGGHSIRNQDRCRPTAYPYGCNGEWAMIYTSDQGAQFGAMFIDFNVDGDPNKARGYFKNIDGEVVDRFTITSQNRDQRQQATSQAPARLEPSAVTGGD